LNIKNMPKAPEKKGKKNGPLKSPKGMRDILGDEYYALQGLFEKAQEIAIYYGFKPIDTPILEKEELFARGVGEHTDIVEKEMYNLKTKGGNKLVMRPEGTAPAVRAYIEHGMHTLPQPVMLYYEGPFFRHENPQRGRYRQFRQFGLEIMGTDKSIADAIIMRTMVDILEEVGFSNLCIDINSIGDKDCRPAYTRALIAYYKKNVNSLCSHCKQRLKENPLRILDCKNEKCETLKEDAPDSLGHLCDGCKKHFKEVLEYLDTMDIPYKINNSLVRGLDYYSRTVFEIIETAEEPDEQTLQTEESETVDKQESAQKTKDLTIVAGGRYDGLAKIIGSRKPISAVGASMGMNRVIGLPEIKNISPRIIKKPKVYFIQIGFEAKLKSLSVIEILRKAHVPIAQSLSKDGLGAQLAIAEKMNIPFVVIFGQKEAMDKTVIVRNMNDRSQNTVKIEKLADYLKKVK